MRCLPKRHQTKSVLRCWEHGFIGDERDVKLIAEEARNHISHVEDSDRKRVMQHELAHEERLLDDWIAFKHARGFQNLKERRIFSWRSALIMSRRGGATYCPKLAVAAVCDRRRCAKESRKGGGHIPPLQFPIQIRTLPGASLWTGITPSVRIAKDR